MPKPLPLRYPTVHRRCTVRLRGRSLILLLSIPLLAFGGHKPGLGWPEVSTVFFHATTPAAASERLLFWSRQTGYTVQGYRDTGSMQPVLKGGRELLIMEICGPLTRLRPGQMVCFDRGDLRAVVHYIAAISRDGTHLYLSGVNNRHSDGWYSRQRVAFVVREIITRGPATPQPGPVLTAGDG